MTALQSARRPPSFAVTQQFESTAGAVGRCSNSRRRNVNRLENQPFNVKRRGHGDLGVRVRDGSHCWTVCELWQRIRRVGCSEAGCASWPSSSRTSSDARLMGELWLASLGVPCRSSAPRGWRHGSGGWWAPPDNLVRCWSNAATMASRKMRSRGFRRRSGCTSTQMSPPGSGSLRRGRWGSA